MLNLGFRSGLGSGAGFLWKLCSLVSDYTGCLDLSCMPRGDFVVAFACTSDELCVILTRDSLFKHLKTVIFSFYWAVGVLVYVCCSRESCC